MDATTLRNVCLAVSAIIMAIEQGLKGAPNFRASLPRVLASERWNFAPIILLTIAAGIWVYRATIEPAQPGPTVAMGTSATSPQPGKWRRISESEKWRLARRLREYGAHKIQIVRYTNPDCEDLAQDFSDVFDAAGWTQPYPPTVNIGGSLEKGVTIRTLNENDVSVLRDILTAALKLDIRKVAQPGMPSDLIQLEIGNPPEPET